MAACTPAATSVPAADNVGLTPAPAECPPDDPALPRHRFVTAVRPGGATSSGMGGGVIDIESDDGGDRSGGEAEAEEAESETSQVKYFD